MEDVDALRRVSVCFHNAVQKVDAVDRRIVARIVKFLRKQDSFFMDAGATMMVLIPGDANVRVVTNVIRVNDALQFRRGPDGTLATDSERACGYYKKKQQSKHVLHNQAQSRLLYCERRKKTNA